MTPNERFAVICFQIIPILALLIQPVTYYTATMTAGHPVLWISP